METRRENILTNIELLFEKKWYTVGSPSWERQLNDIKISKTDIEEVYLYERAGFDCIDENIKILCRLNVNGMLVYAELFVELMYTSYFLDACGYIFRTTDLNIFKKLTGHDMTNNCKKTKKYRKVKAEYKRVKGSNKKIRILDGCEECCPIMSKEEEEAHAIKHREEEMKNAVTFKYCVHFKN